MKDKITIAIPVYERYDFFEESILSAINQSVQATIIVVDNHSSHTRFKDFVLELGMPHVKYFLNESNVGMVENWNRCIQLSDTEWVTILHDDDKLNEDYIKNVSRYFNDISVGCIAVRCELGSEPSTVFNKKYDKISAAFRINSIDYFMFTNLSPFPGITIRKDVALKAGLFNADRFPISDYEFWIRVFENTKIIKLNSILAFYRVSITQSTSNLFNQITIETYFQHQKILNGRTGLVRYLSLVSLYLMYESYDYGSVRDSSFSNLNQSTLVNAFRKINKSFAFPGYKALLINIIKAYKLKFYSRYNIKAL